MVFEKYQRFIEEQFEIVNKQGEAVSFFLNLPQQQFVKQATGRDIVLKARQEGFSSLVGGIFTTDFILDPNSYSVVLADISDNAEGLLDRVKFSLKSYEEKNGFKIPLKYNSKYELVNEAINSKYQIGTAENTDFGRSKTIKNLHMSEAAFFKHFGRLMAGALQAVRPDGRVVIETTANGYNEFKEFWDDSVRGETGFNPLFFSASSFYPQEFLEQRKRELGRLYVQEYPETAEQAFLTTGQCFFDTDVLSTLLAGAREPTKEGAVYL